MQNETSDKSSLLHRHLESLIFCSPESLTIREMQSCMSEMFDSEIRIEVIQEAIQELMEKYSSDSFSFKIENISGGYQFLTKPEYQTSIAILLQQKSKKKLSTAALETLSIIAYKQPVTKSGVEQIRGVNCDYAVQKLLEKNLIEIQGKAETVGRPILYGTTKQFMNYFGINSLEDLPSPKDFKVSDSNEIGDKSEA